jgi:hypothetical protein
MRKSMLFLTKGGYPPFVKLSGGGELHGAELSFSIFIG